MPETDAPGLPLEMMGGELGQDGEAEALVDGLVYAGAKHLLVSPPKAGKTWFAVALSAALRRGEPFLGRAAEPTRVLYLTEERNASFRPKLERFGVEEYDEGFRWLRRSHPDVFGMPWPELVGRVHGAAAQGGAGLVVVDVLHRWAGFAEEAENRSGAVAQVLRELDPLAEDGIATLVLHHTPWESRRARGSTDLHGAMDMLFHLEEPPDGGGAGARTLTFLGGRHEAPERISYRLSADGGGLESLGGETARSASKTSQAAAAVERLGPGPASTEGVAEELGWNVRTARRWLERAWAHRLIARDVKEHGRHEWRGRRAREYLREMGEGEET